MVVLDDLRASASDLDRSTVPEIERPQLIAGTASLSHTDLELNGSGCCAK
jgi:hypothetical protein